MPNGDIDLNAGDPSRADSRSEQRRRRRQAADSKAGKDTGGGGFTETEVRHHLGRAFDGLAKNRETRNDPDLAEAIREEGDAMTEGFVALTENVPPLRLPIVIILNVLITLLAFGRVGGILWERFKIRRAERQAEREQETPGGVTFTEE